MCKCTIASDRESEEICREGRGDGEIYSVRTLTLWSESGLPGNMARLSGALVKLVTCGWDGDGAARPVDPIVNPDSPEPGEELEPETKGPHCSTCVTI